MTFPRVPLRRIARLVNGGTPTADKANWDGDVLWATPVDLGRADLGLVTTTERSLTSSGARFGSALVPPGSVLVSTRAPIGYVARATTQLAFNQGCKALVPDNDLVDSQFLAYWLFASRLDLQSRGTGSTFMELGNEQLLGFRIPVPGLDRQRRIAEFLDDQVARIDMLTASRQAQLDRLDETLMATRAQFFERTLAEAPRRSLRSLCPFFTDGDWIESPYITDEGIRLIQTGNVGVGVFKGDSQRYISAETFHALRCTAVYPDDVLISRLSPPVARSCIAPELGVPAIASVDVVIARPAEDVVDRRYLVEYLSSPRHLSDCDIRARGATMLRLSRSQVGALRIPVPELSIQRAAVGELSALRTELNALSSVIAESKSRLEELKSSLITAAVMGEFHVTTAANQQVAS